MASTTAMSHRGQSFPAVQSYSALVNYRHGRRKRNFISKDNSGHLSEIWAPALCLALLAGDRLPTPTPPPTHPHTHTLAPLHASVRQPLFINRGRSFSAALLRLPLLQIKYLDLDVQCVEAIFLNCSHLKANTVYYAHSGCLTCQSNSTIFFMSMSSHQFCLSIESYKYLHRLIIWSLFSSFIIDMKTKLLNNNNIINRSLCIN